tara:strand:+ start:193 stop:483 length:291 start_codon:yes stop_codon:yes gene_type:complete
VVVLLTILLIQQRLLHQLLHQDKQQLPLVERVIKILVLDIYKIMVLVAVVLELQETQELELTAEAPVVMDKHSLDSLDQCLVLLFLLHSDLLLQLL